MNNESYTQWVEEYSYHEPGEIYYMWDIGKAP